MRCFRVFNICAILGLTADALGDSIASSDDPCVEVNPCLDRLRPALPRISRIECTDGTLRYSGAFSFEVQGFQNRSEGESIRMFAVAQAIGFDGLQQQIAAARNTVVELASCLPSDAGKEAKGLGRLINVGGVSDAEDIVPDTGTLLTWIQPHLCPAVAEKFQQLADQNQRHEMLGLLRACALEEELRASVKEIVESKLLAQFTWGVSADGDYQINAQAKQHGASARKAQADLYLAIALKLPKLHRCDRPPPPPPPPPQCRDGDDNDDDGFIDYPQDPGCESREDDDEWDDMCPGCPSAWKIWKKWAKEEQQRCCSEMWKGWLVWQCFSCQRGIAWLWPGCCKGPIQILWPPCWKWKCPLWFHAGKPTSGSGFLFSHAGPPPFYFLDGEIPLEIGLCGLPLRFSLTGQVAFGMFGRPTAGAGGGLHLRGWIKGKKSALGLGMTVRGMLLAYEPRDPTDDNDPRRLLAAVTLAYERSRWARNVEFLVGVIGGEKVGWFVGFSVYNGSRQWPWKQGGR